MVASIESIVVSPEPSRVIVTVFAVIVPFPFVNETAWSPLIVAVTVPNVLVTSLTVSYTHLTLPTNREV